MSERMITINEFLDNVLADFREYVDSQDKLCDLLDAHFDGGKVPDYSTKPIQQLYLLRYAYAYAFEYKYMYGKLLERIAPGEPINVLSVGCGNLLDYWALAHTIKSEREITYYGLDAVKWSYPIAPRGSDKVKCVIKEAVPALSGISRFPCDIFIFPKSISEFNIKDVQAMADCFAKEKIQQDTVHFLFSFRASPQGVQNDTNKTAVFYNRLLECGFQTQDNRDLYSGFIPQISGKKIREIDSDFHHPSDVVDYLKCLYDRCAMSNVCSRGAGLNCQMKLNRWPILKCEQAAWQIFTFKRQGAA